MRPYETDPFLLRVDVFILLINIAEKFPLIIPSKDEILLQKNANFFASEE